jgi:hypothetical protein
LQNFRWNLLLQFSYANSKKGYYLASFFTLKKWQYIPSKRNKIFTSVQGDHSPENALYSCRSNNLELGTDSARTF